ncbi:MULTISPECIES: YbaB/EbfC family nucleoid-associated protein [Cohaesibacter]|uniref:YbaB/EbfC family nucleoid-associated protein n=1 Tax=Cohaesibacter TaxID=655352 RepID=UPI000DE987EE|nr:MULTISPECIES: YbaB/EbfC family nucleoid-associated protein [Cohaesibacter]TLP46247.1 YbaB/EbfC family nucleoid-associated protein [Cohaesibacter sp. CAU 1516]
MMDMMKMMKKAKEMQAKMAQMQEEVAQMQATGVSGGDMVKVTLSGKGEIVAISIDPSMINPDDAEILEDLIMAAHNDAKAKVEAAMQEEMQKMTGDLGLPAGMKLPF